MVSKVLEKGAGDMDEPTLTEADFSAADEVLRLFPGDGRFLDFKRQSLALMHAHLGSHKFRLYYGLREPENRVEELLRRHHRQELSDEQLRDLLRDHALRPVDSEMLNQFFGDFEPLLADYSLGLQSVAETTKPSCRSKRRFERKATQHFHNANKPLSLLSSEFETVMQFLNEVRLEFSLGLAISGEYKASNAALLALEAFIHSVEMWKSCSNIAWKSKNNSNYLYSVDAGALFFRENGPALPSPRELQVLLQQEQAAARIALERRKPKEAIDRTIANATIHVQNAQFTNLQDLHDPTVESPSSEKGLTRILEVKRWSELVIGYDPMDGFWGLKAEISPGSPFFKSKATNFQLPPSQLRTFLVALAESETGNSVPIAEIVRVFGRLPPATQILRDPRTIPGAIEAGISADLLGEVKAARQAISGVMKDLGKKFREIIAGPTGRSDPCFRTCELDIQSGFVVRCLCITSNGTYTFGPPPFDGG